MDDSSLDAQVRFAIANKRLLQFTYLGAAVWSWTRHSRAVAVKRINIIMFGTSSTHGSIEKCRTATVTAANGRQRAGPILETESNGSAGIISQSALQQRVRCRRRNPDAHSLER